MGGEGERGEIVFIDFNFNTCRRTTASESSQRLKSFYILPTSLLHFRATGFLSQSVRSGGLGSCLLIEIVNRTHQA